MADQLNSCLLTGNVPEWMKTRITVLIDKDPENRAAVGNYRPIMCLPIMWKTLTEIVLNDLYTFLDKEGLLPEEQKGCKRGSLGTNNQLFIDKMTLKESRTRKKNLAVVRIVYKKAYHIFNIHR